MSRASSKLLAAAGAGDSPVYVDDVFSTYLYDGNGSTQNIVNGLDLSGEGGFVWIKARNQSYNHFIFDTARGASATLTTDSTSAEFTTSRISSFNNNGFSLGNDSFANGSGNQYVSWAFRKQEKFFDIVTYTGNGTDNRAIAHNLGSAPGMIVVKVRSNADNGIVYHRSLGYTKLLRLNMSNSEWTQDRWGDQNPTSTHFYVDNNAECNQNGYTYVAYLFAHDEQEFGEDSDEAIIKCGYYTTDSSGDASINLGFEPQFIFAKRSNGTGSWFINDTMRGIVTNGTDPYVLPNTSDAEVSSGDYYDLTSTGFEHDGGFTSSTYIYMAIRQSHKPASEFAATKLFKTVAGRTDSTSPAYETGFVTDMGIQRRPATAENNVIFTRLTGNKYLNTNDNSTAEQTGSNIAWDYMNGAVDYFSSAAYRFWGWKRAKGYFDTVAYTGTGSNRTISHNLGVTPEMMWIMPLSFGSTKWAYLGTAPKGAYSESGSSATVAYMLNHTDTGSTNATFWNSTNPTASVFSLGTHYGVNSNNERYIAYLFASVDGIAKLGTVSVSGTGDTTVDCGFSSGARFVLLKHIGRSDSEFDYAFAHWYLYDSERGITSGNDPYIILDGTATSQVGAVNAIDSHSSGFILKGNSTHGIDGISDTGGVYWFYAIA